MAQEITLQGNETCFIQFTVKANKAMNLDTSALLETNYGKALMPIATTFVGENSENLASLTASESIDLVPGTVSSITVTNSSNETVNNISLILPDYLKNNTANNCDDVQN